MSPEERPFAPGDPCWRRATVEARLAPIAQLGDSHADWFLATHSPIQCRTEKGALLSEAELFERLYTSAAPEQLVAVKGPPGAGKSQLINWLRLRFEDALSRKEMRHDKARKLRTVLIRRRSGSLKDALVQLVEQLPQYERFLDDVKTAIAQISDEQARLKLSFEIAVLLSGRQQSGQLPPDLQYLHQLFQDLRMSRLMCISGGAIDRNIRRLISESDSQAREELPLFSPEEFYFRGKRRGPEVDTLMLDLLEDEEALRVKAAEVANTVLREALANVTGIKGQTLHEVFRGIRRAMFHAEEELALFVEDVSTMSVLDEELVNALEPQGDGDLCSVLSVLGMTIPAYNRLQENKKDRITLAVELEGDLGHTGALPDADGTDRFVARYLNALRAGDAQTAELAEDRRQQGEIRRTPCDGCEQRELCFAAFSYATFDDVKVGLYPLSQGAAFRLLQGLQGSGSSRNPRALLRHVVLPLLEEQGNKSGSRSNSFGISLSPQVPQDLSLVRDTLLGGWSSTQQSQLSYLTWYWAGERKVADARNALEPMLDWFGLPPFTGVRGPRKTPGVEIVEPKGPEPRDPEPKAPVTPPPALEQARQRLHVWFDQKKKLLKDAEFRDLLLDVVKTSLDEENTRSPSFAMQELATSGRPLTASNIFIEDMEAKPAVATKARFRFNRDQGTYVLLNALLDFRYLGRGESWNFEGGIAQQRAYAKWLLQHRDEMLRSFHVVQFPAEEAQRIAAAFIVVAYRFVRRVALPSDTAAAVEALTSFEPVEPAVLTAAGRRAASDVVGRVQKMRDFLFRELSVPQGGARSVTFIDSRVLQEAVTEYRSANQLPAVELKGVESDFPEIYQLLQSDWAFLAAVLKDEHDAMTSLLDDLRKIAASWEIDPEEVQEERGELTRAMKAFLQSARAVVKACVASKQTMGRAELQGRIDDLPPAKINSWVLCLDDALKVEAEGPTAMLALDVAPLIRLHAFVCEIDVAMHQLTDDVSAQMSDVVTSSDVEDETRRAEKALLTLSSCIAKEFQEPSAEVDRAG